MTETQICIIGWIAIAILLLAIYIFQPGGLKDWWLKNRKK